MTDLGRKVFSGIVTDTPAVKAKRAVNPATSSNTNVIDIPEFMKSRHRVMSVQHAHQYQQARIRTSKTARLKKWFMNLFFEL